MGLGDLEVDVRRNVQFKIGEKVMFVGDLMHLDQLGNTQEVVVLRKNGNLMAYKVTPKVIFHGNVNSCSVEDCLEELPAEAQKRLLEIYKREVR